MDAFTRPFGRFAAQSGGHPVDARTGWAERVAMG